MNGTKSSEEEAWRLIRSYAVSGAHDSSSINRMMLRFRPIAPKPATCPDASQCDRDSSAFSGMRRKRKYVRVRRNSGYTRKKSAEEIKHGNDDVLRDKEGTDSTSTLLQLLPETDLNLTRSTVTDDDVTKRDVTRSFSTWETPSGIEGSNRVLVVHSWVIVESVVGTDQSEVMDLERDTCPGFVSDGLNSVVWVNGAFKRMVAKQRNTQEVEVVADLVIRERFPSFYSAFTGHVKLQYRACESNGMESERYSRVVPCDVWRIDGGGFAWRLDVEAALTLGRN